VVRSWLLAALGAASIACAIVGACLPAELTEAAPDAARDASPNDADREMDAATGGDADSSAPDIYFDAADPGHWQKHELVVGPDAGACGFAGGAYDGRQYVYFAPTGSQAGIPCDKAYRYDTKSPQGFDAPESWTEFSTTALGAGTHGFEGAVFDGRSVHFVPWELDTIAALASGSVVAAFDTTNAAGFTTKSAWQTFDLSTQGDGGAKGYRGGTFDGKYVYVVPRGADVPAAPAHGLVARHLAAETSGYSWEIVDLRQLLGERAVGFVGAVFDGNYVTFVPRKNPVDMEKARLVVRYKANGGAFNDPASWDTFDMATITSAPANMAGGFLGGAYDGQYVYFAPYQSGASGVAARYPIGAFHDAGAWRFFDMEDKLVPQAKGFAGAAFDGRYITFAPLQQNSAFLARYDTKASGGFEDANAWQAVNLRATVDPNAGAFFGVVFDGRFLYLVPLLSGRAGHATILRFEARAPSKLPALPAHFGSFY
jgi:hypothetical protein